MGIILCRANYYKKESAKGTEKNSSVYAPSISAMRFYVYGGAPPPSFALGFRVTPPSFDHFWWVKVGLQVVVDDIAESMKGVADEVVESVLENTVMEMARDMACEVCFEEDAPDVWEFQRQGST